MVVLAFVMKIFVVISPTYLLEAAAGGKYVLSLVEVRQPAALRLQRVSK